jgi:hypothetical protein
VSLLLTIDEPSLLQEWELRKKGEPRPDKLTTLIRNWRERYFLINEPGDRRKEEVEDFADTPANRLGSLIDYVPDSQCTRVFCARILEGKSIDEIAADMGVAKEAVTKAFYKAKERLLIVLQMLDRRKMATMWARKASKSLTPQEIGFVLFKVMGLQYSEIKDILPGIQREKGFQSAMARMTKKYQEQMQVAADG